MERLTWIRLGLAFPAIAVVVGASRAATADDWHLYRQPSYGHYDYRDYDGFHDELDHRAFHRELAHREAHRYPMTWLQHERLHDALDHDAFHDELAHRSYHRYYEVPRYQYGYPTYPIYPTNTYGGYYPTYGYGYPAYGSYYRPYGSRFGLSSPRWGVIYNMGY
jgi:hypothetical protein